MSGVVGVYNVQFGNTTDPLTFALFALQSRGENGCGVAAAKHGIRVKRKLGLVGDLFTERKAEYENTFYEFLLQDCAPHAGIGHTLYEKSAGLQPIELEDDKYHLALAMDGTFLGFDEPNDRTLARLFLKGLRDTGNIEDATAYTMKELDEKGFYNAVVLIQHKGDVKLIAFRDPRGGKPLSIGCKDSTYMVCSETQALDGASINFVSDIEPGSVHIIDGKGYRNCLLVEKPHTHCIFEWVYFASPNSVIEAENVQKVREGLGRRLWERHGYRPDALCPSPDSGRGCGKGYHNASGVPMENWITKNPGAPRTFQIECDVQRRLASRSKFNINPMVKGKKIGVPEDSIVRGTVIGKGTADKLKAQGATEASVLVSYAPMPFHCYRSDGNETMAAKGLEGASAESAGHVVAQRVKVDKVFYNSISDVIETCGACDVCTACATGDYHFVGNRLLKFKK